MGQYLSRSNTYSVLRRSTIKNIFKIRVREGGERERECHVMWHAVSKLRWRLFAFFHSTRESRLDPSIPSLPLCNRCPRSSSYICVRHSFTSTCVTSTFSSCSRLGHLHVHTHVHTYIHATPSCCLSRTGERASTQCTYEMRGIFQKAVPPRAESHRFLRRE